MLVTLSQFWILCKSMKSQEVLIILMRSRDLNETAGGRKMLKSCSWYVATLSWSRQP